MPRPLDPVLVGFIKSNDAQGLIQLTLGLSGEEAIIAAEAAFAARAWEANYWRFGDVVWHAMSQSTDGFRRMIACFTALGAIPEEASKALKGVFLYASEYADDSVMREALVTWFVGCAGPNQSEIVTDWLTGRWPLVTRRAPPAPEFLPLVLWTLDNAAGTLRGSREGPSLRVLLAYVDSLCPEQYPLALRLFMTSESLDYAATCDGGMPELLAPFLERALEYGADPSWVHVGLTNSIGLVQTLRVDEGMTGLPGTSRDPRKFRVSLFPKLHEVVMTWVRDRETERYAVLLESLRGTGPLEDMAWLGVPSAVLVQYAREAAATFVDAYVGGPVDANLAEIMERLAERTDTSVTVAMALVGIRRELLAERGIDYDAFMDLVRPARPAGLAALVRYLVPRTDPRGPVLSPDQRGDLEAMFKQLLHVVASTEAYPLARESVGSALTARLCAACTDRNYVVKIVNGTWEVGNDAVYAKLLKEHGSERGLMLCALYFTHEVLHHGQGLADKRDVHALRRTGSELIVMSLDVGADMLAIEWVSGLQKVGWDREALHEATIRGFTSFPASMSHTQASVTRKSLRILCHVFTRLLKRPGFGWAWVELPQRGGTATVWWTQPDLKKVAAFPISAGAVLDLLQAAHDEKSVGTLDDLEQKCRMLLATPL